MPLLYPFSLKDNYESFINFIIQHLPTTASLVGWLALTGLYESDPAGKCKIWTSHSDPLNTQDPVVWLFDSDHRVRMFMTTEPVLDHGETTPEAFQLADSGVYNGKTSPTYFVDPQLEKLYNKSKEILKPIIQEFVYEIKQEAEAVLFHGINVIWSPVIHPLMNVEEDGPCFKFVKPLSSCTEKRIILPEGLVMGTLGKEDVKIVHSTNKVTYNINYVEDCFRISSAIRRADNNELAAWSMTHRDCFVGSLHVLPDYRRKGFGEIILQDICRQYADYYKRVLPDVAEKLYFGSSVENFNESSANLFKKAGWKTLGLGMTWIYATKKTQ